MNYQRKKRNRKFTAVLAACMFILIYAFTSFAGIDTKAKCSLEIDYAYSGTKLEGADFCLYKVGDITADRKFSLTEKYSKYPVSLDADTQDDWRKAAETLKSYIDMDSVDPDYSGTTDPEGKIKFTNLDVGLYLIAGETLTKGTDVYIPTTFLLSLPNSEDEGQTWEYDVVTEPKLTVDTLGYGGGGEPRKVSCKVIKAWNDGGAENTRPDSVEVMLLKDGTPYDRKVITKADNWEYTWTNLPSGYRWTVAEIPVAGYLTVNDVNRETVVITNTATDLNGTDKMPKGMLPQTGLPYVAAVIMFVAAAIVVFICVRKKSE